MAGEGEGEAWAACVAEIFCGAIDAELALALLESVGGVVDATLALQLRYLPRHAQLVETAGASHGVCRGSCPG